MFGTSGLANGLQVMSDEKTWSNWDHITGECFEGPLRGRQLEVWPMRITTAGAALHELPELTIARTEQASLSSLVTEKVRGYQINKRGMIPPPFFATMSGKIDDRAHRLEVGLGVVAKDLLGATHAKFFPMSAVPRDSELEDNLAGRAIVVSRGSIDDIPRARWGRGGTEPMQMLARWYGFSFTFPGCGLWT